MAIFQLALCIIQLLLITCRHFHCIPRFWVFRAQKRLWFPCMSAFWCGWSVLFCSRH